MLLLLTPNCSAALFIYGWKIEPVSTEKEKEDTVL